MSTINSSQSSIQPVKDITIMVVGDRQSGKKSLIQRFVEDKFESNLKRTVDWVQKQITVENKEVNIRLFEENMAPEKLESGGKYARMDAIVLAYDVTNQASFNRMKELVQEVDRYAKSNVKIIIVGTKNDDKAHKMVDPGAGEDFAKEHGYDFIETSAKTDMNVQAAFKKIVSNVINDVSKTSEQQPLKMSNKVQVSNNKTSNKVSQAWRKCQNFFSSAMNSLTRLVKSIASKYFNF